MSKATPMPKTMAELKAQIAVGALGGESLKKLLRSKKTSSDILRMVYHSSGTEDDARRLLLKNPSTPVDVLEDIAAHIDSPNANWWWADKVFRHPSFPLTKLLEIIKDEVILPQSKGPQHIVQYVMRNPQLPADILTTLSTHPEHAIRSCVAEHRNTPSDVLATFKDDVGTSGWYSPQVSLAGNPNTPPEILHEITMAVGVPEGKGLRSVFAKPQKTSAALRKAAANNPSTLTRTLWCLATGDVSASIRGMAFDNLHKRGAIVVPQQ